jgi:hypothetical protein
MNEVETGSSSALKAARAGHRLDHLMASLADQS